MTVLRNPTSALRLSTPRQVMELRAVVADRLRAGASRESVYAELNRLRDELRAAGKSNEADVVADVMDFVVGWSSPHVAL